MEVVPEVTRGPASILIQKRGVSLSICIRASSRPCKDLRLPNVAAH